MLNKIKKLAPIPRSFCTIRVFKETHDRFLGIVEGIPATDLWKDRAIRAQGKKVTIGRLLEADLQDEEEHYFQLKQFIESGVKS